MKKNYLPHFSNQRFNIRHLLTALLFISTLIGLSIRMSSANNRLKVFICNSESPSHFFMPDSTFDSTINTENYSYGDTMEFYLDGPDTIYMLYVDTTTADSISSLERAFTSDDIVISLTDVVLPVQEGLFGFNTQDIFRLTHYDPADNVIYSALGLDNPKELMVSLAPKNLRYPSGSSSKFRHALGSWNSSDPNNPFHDQKNGGYGINIEEMIPYYDITNPFVPYPGFLIVYNDFIEDSEHDIDGNWLIDDVKASFEDFFGEWLEQPHYDPGMYLGIWEEPLYINEFIGMVKAIEDENPGFTVDVIYTLDILSEPAAECKLIIEYLRNESLNHQLDVNVVGVELGNECYNNFFEFTMGFKLYDDYTAFEHYWAYINGADDYNTFFGITGDFDLSAVYIDAKEFLPHIPTHQYPGQSLVAWLYLEGGIRSCEIGSLMFGKYDESGILIPAMMELVRLAIPRRVYTQSHIDYVAEVIIDVFHNRNLVKGMEIIFEAPSLRHFTAKLKDIE